MARRERPAKGEKGEREPSELIDKLTHINRVSKVVKGGRRFGFAALVVAGDKRGRVGFGHGKAREVPEAIRKATDEAKKNLISVPLYEGRTLHHDVSGRWGAGRVILRAAPPGTGIIAGGPARAVFETLGMQDVVAKSIGSSNPYNVVRATFSALRKECSPRMVAARRGKKPSEVVTRPQRRSAGEDAAKKDDVKKDDAKKDDVKKDAAKKEAVKKDAAKKDAAPAKESKQKESKKPRKPRKTTKESSKESKET